MHWKFHRYALLCLLYIFAKGRIRFALMLFLIGSATTPHAQIEVSAAAGSNVGVGTTPSISTKLLVLNNVASGLTTLGLRADVTTGSFRYGLYGNTTGAGSYAAGITASASGASENRGAYGVATALTGQTAYGIYGSAGGAGTRYAGYFSGNVVITGNLTVLSDERFKTDVRPLAEHGDSEGRSILERVLLLSPRFYGYTADPAYAHMNLPDGEHFGFVAEEIEEVFPQVVNEAVHPAEFVLSEDGETIIETESIRYRSVSYSAIVPLLTQALQEQQALIEALRAEVEALRALVVPPERRE